MTLVENLKSRKRALNVRELAELFDVTPQHIYKMAASGSIPSFRVLGAIRFDPENVACWLQEKQAPVSVSRRVRTRGVAA